MPHPPDHPHVELDVTAALAGAPSVTIGGTEELVDMPATVALAIADDLRSAALVAAQLEHERETTAGYEVATDLVGGGS